MSASIPEPKRSIFELSPLNQRRWANFKANRRGYYSLWIFGILYLISLGAELVANDKPLLVSYRGEILSPLLSFYPEKRFGGTEPTAADYTDPAVQCLIKTGGLEECLDADEPAEVIAKVAKDPKAKGAGWILWPLIPWSYSSLNKEPPRLPAPPSADNWFGTDTSGRDIAALTIYGFRLSVSFGLIVTLFATMIGVLAGAAQGYFGGWVDLFFQRIVEIWSTAPLLYVILIVSSVFPPNFWILTLIMIAFSWVALVGLVRAEFLRARNFEYVRAAQALGLTDTRVMMRHVLPNAMVATLTMLPFLLTSSIGTLAILDFLGFGLSGDYPSLGELTLQARSNPDKPWLAAAAFLTFAIMLSLLVFIFEAVRDAFDPRKTFA
ncbi:MAG: ABC transporter permease [Neomegalonema sp.]|nr:ABC transporter permease [Neomegalonema sp.]